MTKKNQSPKGIIWSAVPLPCFFAVLKSQRVAGQRPREGTKSCRMGRNSVRLSIRPFVHLWACQRALRVLRANLSGQRGLRASQRSLRASQRGLRACQGGLRASQGGTDGRTDGRMDGRMDGQNFFPFYRTLSPVGAAALLL